MEKQIYHYLFYHTIDEYKKLHPRGTSATISLPFSLARRRLEREWGIKLDLSGGEYRSFAKEVKMVLKRGEI